MRRKLIIGILLSALSMSFMGCSKKSNNDFIEDNARMKVLNVKYIVDDNRVSNLKILCDTKTNLLYLAGVNDTGGLTIFNHLETNHDGDVVTKQYTLEEFQRENQKTMIIKLSE